MLSLLGYTSAQANLITMESIDNDTLERLQAHLELVSKQPYEALDQKLLDESEFLLAPRIAQDSTKNAQLIQQISSLLPTLQQNPEPVINLLRKLVKPLSFADVLKFEPQVDFVGGLNVAALPYNRLMLELLSKAKHAPNDLTALANQPDIVAALVTLWLATDDVGVADYAGHVLEDLLEADQEKVSVATHGIGDAESSSHGGQGLLWRRLFGDRDIYSLLFSACTATSAEQQKKASLAKARLLAFAPRLGRLDWSYLTRSHHQNVEKQYGVEPPFEGFLDFVAVKMVDYAADVLLHINLIQCYEELLSQVDLDSLSK